MKTLITCLLSVQMSEIIIYSQRGKVDVYDIKTTTLAKFRPSGMKVFKSAEGDWQVENL